MNIAYISEDLDGGARNRLRPFADGAGGLPSNRLPARIIQDSHGIMATLYVRSRAQMAPKMHRRFFALLGILALFSMMALATWHDALPHMDDVEHVHTSGVDHHQQASEHQHEHASGHHRHDDGDDHSDGNDVVHVAAHAVVQGVDIPAQPVIGMMPVASVARWVMAPADRIDSVKPDSLLRPPRA